MRKLTLRIMTPAKTQISLRIRAVRSESRADHMCLLQPPAIQKEMNENPCHTGWMCKLICLCCRFYRALAQIRLFIYLFLLLKNDVQSPTCIQFPLNAVAFSYSKIL